MTISREVKLPVEICDALDLVRVDLTNYEIIHACHNMLFGKEYYFYKDEITVVECLNDICEEDLIRALILGYQPIKSNEEQIKELFFIRNHLRDEFDKGYCKGVRDALRIHGIKYEWLEDDAEC